MQPAASSREPTKPAAQGDPRQAAAARLTGRTAQVEDRPLSLPACLAGSLLEEEKGGGGGTASKDNTPRRDVTATLITWNSSQRRPGRCKYGQQMEMLKALK